MYKHFLTNKVWRGIRHKDPLLVDASSFFGKSESREIWLNRIKVKDTESPVSEDNLVGVAFSRGTVSGNVITARLWAALNKI
ncbi:MAG: hypothetical protein LBD04_08205 [Synergistaceae bacterium]|jgi:hypothetical protein|nr:hypothetical protein [Synergistaceae bacterium]